MTADEYGSAYENGYVLTARCGALSVLGRRPRHGPGGMVAVNPFLTKLRLSVDRYEG